ncbi:MAG: DNA sulfur modification protein DndD [Bacteroidales bacterium]|nr:DNA sulfur modification protein DndD [Bacteroidales bacterium]
MIIKEIELNNFRIYHGANRINLTPDGERNIVIVSGDNGFGKTTFLMSLVWCLYGKQMEKVDDLYKTEIQNKGGYSKYLGNSLNQKAKSEGRREFSVALTFTGVDIPDSTCTEIKITRYYNSVTGDERLEILIDGRYSELFRNEQENELFIRDYILPIEIAKFFFFDAEKIVSFAQINTPEQRAELSKAYSQVLGIQKYDELKKELERLQDEYRKESAQPSDRTALYDLISQISSNENEILEIDRQIERDREEIASKKHEINELQEKLIREGDLMSVERLNELKSKRESQQTVVNAAQEGLKELYNYIPFGLAGEVISSIVEQLNKEKQHKQDKLQMEGVDEKTDKLLNDLDKAKRDYDGHIDIKISRFYEDNLKRLILRHFYSGIDAESFSDFQILHDFTELQHNGFLSLVQKIKESKNDFQRLSDQFTQARAELQAIDRQIREAEKNAEGDYIQSLREKKDSIERETTRLLESITRQQLHQEQLRESNKTAKQKKEILTKKIDVSDKNKAVDEEAERLIQIIQKFLQRFKDEKKRALESKMEHKLGELLQKKDLVHKVAVDILGNGEDVDINLLDANQRRIDKGILSMGERQMFATALLGALVDETEIEFPVFIDSPMQKFDQKHSQNILTKFYPTVSKQVVLFPLLTKELTEDEYALIEANVNRTYLIQHTANGSYFEEIRPHTLFATYQGVSQSDVLLYIRSADGDINATGKYVDDASGGFMVRKGSTIASETLSSISGSVRQKRDELMQNGVLKLQDGRMTLMEDVILLSPNQAAVFVLGYAANRHEWKEITQ